MIHMNNVTKVYPNGSTGVENINLHINKGEFCIHRWFERFGEIHADEAAFEGA